MAGPKKSAKRKTHAAENIAAVFGALLVLGSIAVLLYSAQSQKNSPPDLNARISSIEQFGSGYLVQFKVSNSGGSTAATVRVAGTLSNAAHPDQTSEAIIDYVPPHSEREGGLMFAADPRLGKLEVRATGYSVP